MDELKSTKANASDAAPSEAANTSSAGRINDSADLPEESANRVHLSSRSPSLVACADGRRSELYVYDFVHQASPTYKARDGYSVDVFERVNGKIRPRGAR